MILVVGATGLLGGMITRRLLADGHDVRILVRPGSDYGALEAAGARPVQGDLKDPASLRRACEAIDVVISTANSAARGGPDNVESVEVHGNRALVDAARAAGVRRLVFVSALGADENSPVPFMRGKAAAERHLRESGMTYTILQPNIFLEVWGGMLVGMPLQAGQPVTLVGEGRNRHSMISVTDVAAFTVAAIDAPEAHGRTLVLGGPEPVSWRDVVAAFERAVGHPIEVRTVAPGERIPGLPETVAQLAASFDTYESPVPMEETARVLGVSMTCIDDAVRAMLTAPGQPPAH